MTITQSMAKTLQTACKFATKAEKVAYLQANDSPPLRAMLCMAMDPTVEFDLPDTRPPYNENEWTFDQEGMLFNEMKKTYLFLKGPNKIFGDKYDPNVRDIRRQQLFIQFLESLQADDADMICTALESKRLPWKGLTPRIVNDAFGDLITIPEKVKGTKEETTEEEDA